MADTLTPVPALWRSAAPSAARSRRRSLLWVLLALTLLAGTALGLLHWLTPPPAVAVLPVWVTAEPDGGPVPWAEQDRAALLDAGLLGRPLADTAANPSRDQIRLRFEGLSRVPRSQPVAVVLAAPAAVDAAGGVYLVPADPRGDSPRNRLPLAELLAHVRDCPARHKLLVLHLSPPTTEPPAADLTAAVLRTLDAADDPNRLCLVVCGPVEGSAEVGRSAVAHYLEDGLRGAADGWAGESRDGRVSAVELAAFVRARVSRWPLAATPVLVGTAPDFTLQSYPRSAVPAAEEPAPADPTYPDWLRAGWERHDRWLAADPRPVPRLRAALLAAERALHAGRPAADVQRDLDRRLAAIEQSALPAVPSPNPPPTLAALFPGYVLPEPALLDELRTAGLKADARPPAPAVDEKSPPPPPGPPPLPADFEPFKAKPPAALAAAAVVLLADDPAPTAARVRRLARLLADRDPAPRFAETLLVHRLAALPDEAWSPRRAALALSTARLFEDAAARPGVVAWLRPSLDAAYRRRADAEAALFAPGYVSFGEADRRLLAAEEAARGLKAAADQLRAAAAVHDEVQVWLAGVTPAVDGRLVPSPVAAKLADAARALAAALTPPAAPPEPAAVPAVIRGWQEKAAAARAALADVARPFRPAAVARLRDRADAGDAGPAVLADLDAVLATPLPTAADRVTLWLARAALHRRLVSEVLRRDRHEDESYRRELARPPVVDPREPPAGTSDGERPARREARAAQPRDAAGGGGDARRLWAWHAARFRYEARDAADPAVLAFATAAERAAALVGPPEPEPYLEVAAKPAAVTDPQKAAELAIGLRVLGAADKVPVVVDVAGPSPEWVKPTPAAAKLVLEPLRETPVLVPLAAGEKPAAHPALRGVLVEATAGGRTFHRRAAVDLDPLANRLDLRVAHPDGRITPAAELRVRPNTDPVKFPQKYQLRVYNPTTRPRAVVVRLPDFDRESAPLKLPPLGEAVVVFPAPAPPPAPAIPVPAPAAPPTEPPPDPALVGFEPVPGSALRVLLLNPDDRVVRQTVALPVRVENPADYLRVEEVVFVPASGQTPNRLRVRVLPERQLVGPPCPVVLGVRVAGERPDDPPLVIPDGKLSGVIPAGPLPADGGALTLYAENVRFPAAAGATVVVTVTADGVERAFTYTAFLPALGQTVRLAPFTDPRVRVIAPKFATGLDPLPVKVEVDNPPAGAALELRLGPPGGDAADVTFAIDPAKAGIATVKFDPKGDAFQLRGVLADPEARLPVGLLVGVRGLTADLFDRDDELAATHTAAVTFDNAPPRNVRFLGLSPQLPKGQKVLVRAACDPTVSGIREVKFFFGAPVKGEPPASAAPVTGEPAAGLNEWRAVLDPGSLSGPAVVGVLFVTNAGQRRVGTADVEFVDAAELAKPKPGAVAGRVLEQRLPQGGREVFLYDDKKAARAKTTSKPDGTFEFKDLPPGKYYLYTQNEVSNTEATADVDVAAGETAAKDLTLLLRAPR